MLGLDLDDKIWGLEHVMFFVIGFGFLLGFGAEDL